MEAGKISKKKDWCSGDRTRGGHFWQALLHTNLFFNKGDTLQTAASADMDELQRRGITLSPFRERTDADSGSIIIGST
ncbi:MAG: hypothetical protein J5729_01220 [Bacteroidaceae bacterium]|nr:hypothetical protein [Bacteroidaceae bacterium]